MSTTGAVPNPGPAPAPAKLGLLVALVVGSIIGSCILGPENMAAGSIGPKVEAARALVLASGQRAVIGSLDRIVDMLAGSVGTQVCLAAAGGADTL